MSHGLKFSRGLAYLIVLLAPLMFACPVTAQVPEPPLTDRFSVQMFAGTTQNCWIAVYPPKNYADGTPIPAGTPVTIKVLRSFDGGKTYGDRDVKVVAMGEGKVGQGENNGQEKEWIDCKLETPVDEADPYAIWLAAASVVNGKTSEVTNRYLQFRYREKGGGRPVLIRYETPDVSGDGVADEPGRPLPQELAGKWEKGGKFIIRSFHVTPGMQKKIDAGEVEGCNAAILKAIEGEFNKPMDMSMNVKTIDLVGAPGLNGATVDPVALPKKIFPGTATFKIVDPKKPGDNKEGDVVDFAYNYATSFIKIEQTKDNSRSIFGGHFFKNATDYMIFGTWKVIYTDPKAPGEWFELRGTWSVSRDKPA